MLKSVTKSKLSREDIVAIINNAFPNQEINDIYELTEGMYNSVYRIEVNCINYILKIAPSKNVKVLRYEHNIMQSEVDFCNKYSNQYSFIPKVIAYDNSCRLIDKPYFIMNHIEGRSFSEFSRTKSDCIYHQLGNLVSSFNPNTEDYYGYPEGKHHNSMREFYNDAIDNILIDGEEINIRPVINSNNLKLIKELSVEFNSVNSPSLVHFDIWEGNVFVNNNNVDEYEITGIIDWERGFYGDYLGDFISMKFFQHVRKNRAFIDGYYGSSYQFNYNELVRLSLLRIYLFSIIITESYYREIRNSYLLNKLFGRFMLRREIRNLKKLYRSNHG